MTACYVTSQSQQLPRSTQSASSRLTKWIASQTVSPTIIRGNQPQPSQGAPRSRGGVCPPQAAYVARTSAAPHSSDGRTARARLEIDHGDAVKGRRLPMRPLKELKLQLHPPASLKCVEKRARQDRHEAIGEVCHDDEVIGEEEMHGVAYVIDGKVDRRSILKIPSAQWRKRSGTRKIEPSCSPRCWGPFSHNSTTLSMLRLVLAVSVTA